MTLSRALKHILPIIFLSISNVLSAKADLLSRIRLSVEQNTPSARNSNENNICAIVRLNDGFDAQDLTDAGFSVQYGRGDIVLAYISTDSLPNLYAVNAVKSVSFGNTSVRPLMDKARISSAVNYVQEGQSIVDGHKYLGEGVLLGMMDQGLDPNHINFISQDRSVSRFSAIWTFLNKDGSYDEYSDDNVSLFTTDMPESFHGTYTAGIMAGGYNGPGTAGIINADGKCYVRDINIPYRGVAPMAEIVAGCGNLTDANIITAIEKIVEYGKASGRRPVINLSIGSAGGSFDMAEPLCAYLNEVSREDAIIIAAAGNDGHKPMSISRDFKTGSDKPVITFFNGLKYTDDESKEIFYVQIWTSDSTHPDVEIIMSDRNTGRITTIHTVTETDSPVILTSQQETDKDYIYSPELASAFDGSIYMAREINSVNHRSSTIMAIDLRQHSDKSTAVIGLRIKGQPGQLVQLTTDGRLQLSAFNIEGAENGNPDLSISNLVCGENIISVGAYVSRTGNGCLDGSTTSVFNYFYADQEGAPAYFSSYTALPDGRTYPTVCAPGNEVISSYSRYYTSSLSDTELGKYAAVATDNAGGKHYWRNECGTSAATPVVAGIVATWMEADPTLKSADVLDIIRKTSTTDNFTQSIDKPARFGCGKINALAGLNEVLSRRVNTEGIAADSDRISVTADGRHYSATAFGSTSVEVRVYDINGRQLRNESGNDESIDIDLTQLQKGIYIMSIIAHTGAATQTHNIKIAL